MEKSALCRHAVRSYFFERGQSIAQEPTVVARVLRSQGQKFEEAEVAEACAFLADLSPPQLRLVSDGISATKNYQITSQGILEEEKSRL